MDAESATEIKLTVRKRIPERAPNESLPNHHNALVDQIEHGRKQLTIC